MASTDMTFDVFNWRILSPENKLPNPESPKKPVSASSTQIYDLYNRNEKETLKYGERFWGINLVWGDPGADNSIRFERKNGGAAGAIKSGDVVAIHVKGGGFVKYHVRDSGINLGWSETPVFEWKLVLSEIGAPILTGSSVGIFNMVEKDFLFYDPRTYGINLKWLKDKGKYNKSWYDSILDSVVDLAKNVKVSDLLKLLL